MKIRRLLARGFGCLRGEFRFAADRVNLVLEPNERGKSTLAAAILAGLYGFPPGQRRSDSRPLTDLDIYRPWDGGDYLVELDVEVEGRVYTLRRDFDRKEDQVLEWRTGKEVTAQFQASKETIDFAQRMTGLDRDDFVRTIFLRQNEIREVRHAGGLTAALQRMATSQHGDVAAAEAIETLRSALRHYRGRKIRRGRVENEIAEIDEEIEILSRNLQEIEDRRRRAEARILELEQTSAEEGRIDSRLQRVEFLVLAAGRREDAVSLAEEERERRELDERESEFQSLRRYASLPVEGLARIRELKGRLLALAGEEERIRSRATEEVDAPRGDLEERARRFEGLSKLSPLDLSRFSSAETDLVAAWKARKEGRRARRTLQRRLRSAGTDPEMLRTLSGRVGSLGAEERRFLLDCGERELTARTALLEAQREAEERAGALRDVETRIGRARSLSLGLGTLAAVALAAAIALWFSGQPRTWAYAAAAVGALAAVIRLALRPSGADEGRLGAMWAERDAAERAVADRSAEIDEVRSRLLDLASRAGLDSGEMLLKEFREAEARGDDLAEQAAVTRRLTEAGAALREATAVVSEIMDAAGHRPRFGAITPRTARAFRNLAGAHRERLSRLEELRERRRAFDHQIGALSQEIASIRQEAEDLLRAAGIEPTEDLDEGVARFEEGLQRKERYETLKREIIPTLVRRSMSHKGESLRRSVEIADGVLRKKVLENPELESLVPEKSHKEYVEERDRLRQESRSLVEKRLELANDLGDVLKEYRKDYPTTQLWLREWQEQRERAAAFKEAVDLACETLEAISREAYAEWADVLNERASEFLSRIAPGYGDLRFDQDLSFTVRDGAEGVRRSREEVDLRLSAGARDQIYLAARLAMADYLSSGKTKLPLILDDPFASFDDERFSSATLMLLEKLSRRHQVILLSCHEARHRQWQESNPERFAERVRVMTLQTTVA